MTFITSKLPTMSTSACLIACVGISEPRGHSSLSAMVSSAKPSTGLYSRKANFPESMKPADTIVNARATEPNARQHTLRDDPR